jgi:hypothetical protein
MGKIKVLSLNHNKNKIMFKYQISFTTPTSGGRILKETIEATQWSHAKIMMESKYPGVKITHYITIK